MKPGVVFFNEPLPSEFYENVKKENLACADLLLIFGTTLKVKPFSLITKMVPQNVPQVLINRSNLDVA